MNEFRSMKARELLAVLTREPLGYEIARQRGSHRRLKAPPITFAFHDGATPRRASSARSCAATSALAKAKR